MLLLTGFAQILVAIEAMAADAGGTQVVFLDGFEERVCETTAVNLNVIDSTATTYTDANWKIVTGPSTINAISETIVHLSSDAEGLEVVGLRSVLIPALLGRPTWQVSFPPAGWLGTIDTEFVLVLQALHLEADSQLISNWFGKMPGSTFSFSLTRKPTR
jgi:hypothetical protein